MVKHRVGFSFARVGACRILWIGGVAMGSKKFGVRSELANKAVSNRANTARSEPSDNLNSSVRQAISEGNIRLARDLLAAEEQRVSEIGLANTDHAHAQIAAGKARIALATQDGAAAHAILLSAIEAAPENRSLRVLMSEVMLSNGRATDVRPVLSHIGRDPAEEDAPLGSAPLKGEGSA